MQNTSVENTAEIVVKGDAPSKCNVYVARMPAHFNDDRLLQIALEFGEVVSARAMPHRHTGACKGYGFVLFATPEAAARCVEELHGRHFQEKTPAGKSCSFKIQVRFADDDATDGQRIADRPGVGTANPTGSNESGENAADLRKQGSVDFEERPLERKTSGSSSQENRNGTPKFVPSLRRTPSGSANGSPAILPRAVELAPQVAQPVSVTQSTLALQQQILQQQQALIEHQQQQIRQQQAAMMMPFVAPQPQPQPQRMVQALPMASPPPQMATTTAPLAMPGGMMPAPQTQQMWSLPQPMHFVQPAATTAQLPQQQQQQGMLPRGAASISTSEGYSFGSSSSDTLVSVGPMSSPEVQTIRGNPALAESNTAFDPSGDAIFTPEVQRHTGSPISSTSSSVGCVGTAAIVCPGTHLVLEGAGVATWGPLAGAAAIRSE